MATEQYANFASTTLNGSISNSATSITVTDGSVFPSSGDFAILIENELMVCTARSTNTLTVARGQEGTTAASHANAKNVYSPLTKRSLLALPDRFHVRGALSSRPAAGDKGRLFLPTDHIIASYDDGSAWQNFGPIWQFNKPSGSFSWLNQGGTATVVDDAAGTLIEDLTSAGSVWEIRARKKTRNSTATGSKIIVGIMPMLANTNFAMTGVGVRESSSGKIEVLRIHYDSADVPFVSVTYITAATGGTPTGLSTAYSIPRHGVLPNLIWLQIEQTSTNLVYSISLNGITYRTVHTHSITEFFSAAPDELILFVVPYNQPASAFFPSLVET